MKKYILLIMILISGCNEFIDLTGKFINRLNDTSNSIINLTVSVRNLQSEALPNMLVSIIDDHDSLLITSPKFTNSFSTIHFSLPDEQVRGISPEAQNLIIIAEHPDIGTYINVISASGISDQHFISEFIIDIPQEVLLKSVIENYPFYNKTQKKFMY